MYMQYPTMDYAETKQLVYPEKFCAPNGYNATGKKLKKKEKNLGLGG